MEHPYTGVVGNHTKRNRASWWHLDGITTHRIRLAFLDRWIELWVGGSVVLHAIDNLKLVAVKMAVDRKVMMVQSERSCTYNGWFPTSPFFKIICTALR